MFEKRFCRMYVPKCITHYIDIHTVHTLHIIHYTFS